MLHILSLLLVHAQAVYLRLPAVPVSVLMPHPNENCLQQRVVRSSDIKTFSDTWNSINYGCKLPHYNSILRNRFDLPISSNLGSTPPPSTSHHQDHYMFSRESTKSFTCHFVLPLLPSFISKAPNLAGDLTFLLFLARNAKTSSRRAWVLVPNKQNMEKPFDDSLYIFVSSTWYCSSKTPHLI